MFACRRFLVLVVVALFCTACGDAPAPSSADSATADSAAVTAEAADAGGGGGAAATETTETLRFAVVGDYGTSDSHEYHVAQMVQGWAADPGGLDFIISVGDNNYNSTLSANTYLQAVCANGSEAYYGPFVKTPQDPGGSVCTASTNKFHPAPGNHDWNSSVEYSEYSAFFPEAGSSDANLFYEFTSSNGLVQFFSVNSNCPAADSGGTNENSGNHGCPVLQSGDCATQYSTQRQQIISAMTSSTASWNLVYFHHPPFSAAGNEKDCVAVANGFRFAASDYVNKAGHGLTAVFSGHSHVYERIFMKNAPQMPYFIVGMSGKSHSCGTIDQGPGMASALCYDDHHGAALVTASASQMKVEYYQHDSTTPVDVCTFTRDQNGNQQASCTQG